MAGRTAVLLALVGHVSGQCTLPGELPADTQFAPGQPANCVLGE